ncbi:MAG: hypothetical protein K6A23_05900 [Butyrivibrio sp.]|nr:hypothetical protein [Butyrivibrio sp.]
MRRKEFLSLLSLLSMTVMLMGCGDASATNENTIEEIVVDDAAEELSKEGNDLATEEKSEESSEVVAEEATDFVEPKLSLSTIIDENVLFDDGTVKITAKSLEFKYNSPVLNLEFENNGDKTLTFISGSLGYSCNSVNGYMDESMYVNVSVDPGKTATESVYINADLLKVLGISNVKEIGIAFDIKDDDFNQYTTTGPLIITTSDADIPDNSEDSFIDCVKNGYFEKIGYATVDYFSEENLMNVEELKILSEGVFTNAEGEISAFIELENSTDQQVEMAVSDIEINGLMLCSGGWTSRTINEGKKCLLTIGITDVADYAGGTLQEMGITEISTIGFAADVNDINNNDLYDENIVIRLSENESSVQSDGTELYNANDIRILTQTVTEDDSDINILLRVENNSQQEAKFDVEYDSLSINDKMSDFLAHSTTIAPGKAGILKIEINSWCFEDSGITSLEDIESVECTVEIKDKNYNDIDSAVVKMEF